MSKKILAVAMMALGVGLAAKSQAASSSGVLATANVYMYNNSIEQTPGGESDSKSSVYDIKLGYLNGSGLYLGGLYTIRKTESGSSSTDGNALGASIGYVGASGFYVKGHYIASATFGDFKEGTGFQGDLGYLTTVGNSFVVGVELTHRIIDYKKNDSIAGLDSYKMTETFPMLTVGFIF